MAEVNPENRRVKLAEIAPHKRNYNRHPASQVERIAASLRKFGQVRSIVVWRSTILAGHGVVEAARSLGWTEVAADVLPDEYPEHLALAYVAADNELGRLGDPDQAALAAILEESRAADAELLEAMGYSDNEFEALLAEVGMAPAGAVQDAEPQIDRAEELRQKWGVEPGQLWQLGEHRLICGDCTDAAVVARVMGGEKAQMLFTSPPYWVGKEYEQETSLVEIKQFIRRCASAWPQYVNLDGGRIIVNCSTASARAMNAKADPETLFTLAWWQDAMRDVDWLMRHCRIWLKHGDMAAPRVAARSDVVDQHWETIPEFLPTFYYPDGLRRGQEKIGMKWAQLGVWSDIAGERSADGTHTAAFPVELPNRYLMLYTVPGEVCLEPFSGSGTTLIACENLGRRCRAVEIAPGYVAVALERWATATGKTPVLVEGAPSGDGAGG